MRAAHSAQNLNQINLQSSASTVNWVYDTTRKSIRHSS
jgi:hypothetical protein